MLLSAFLPTPAQRQATRIGPRITLLLLPLVLPLFAGSAQAAAGELQGSGIDAEFGFRLKTYAASEGLPQSTPTRILQTRDGYLWLTTFGGLVRFNGEEFATFSLANTAALASNRMTALYEDSDGTLWIGHESGGVTVYRDGAFTAFPPARQLAAAAITEFVRERDGTLWLTLDSGKLARCDINTCAIEPPNGARGETRALLMDSEEQLWLGTSEGLFTRRAGAWTPFLDAQGTASPYVSQLFETQSGQLLLGTAQGILRLADRHFETVFAPLPGEGLRALIEDKNGNIWIGTSDRLLFAHAKPGGEGARKYAAARPIHPEYFDTLIWSLFEDHEGSIWVGTQGRGLSQLTPEIIRRYAEESGLVRREVVAVSAGSATGLTVASGCESPLLQRVEGRFVPITMPDEIDYPCSYALYHDPTGVLWAGLSGQLGRFDGHSWQSFPLPSADPTGRIRSLTGGEDGSLWLGTERAGAFLFEGGEFTRYSTTEGLLHNDVRFIKRDSKGSVWFGTEGGLSRLTDGQFTNYTPANGLSPGTVRAIYEDAPETFWIGTYGGGLSRLKDGVFGRIDKRQGLSEDIVSSILEDDAGNLWMLGNRGLQFVKRQQLADFAEGRADRVDSISFAESEGMVEGSGGTQPAGWKASDGSMWFATMDGVAHVDVNAFRLNTLPPPVIIERVVVDGKEQPTQAQVSVRAGQKNIEIHYAGLSFRQPDLVRFRYRLAGYDSDWQDVGSRRVAYYSDVRPGQYAFEVAAANSHGTWSAANSSLRFTKAPFWYETRTFYALTMALLFLIGYGVYAIRARRINAYNAELAGINVKLGEQIRERQRAEVALEEQYQELQRTNRTLQSSNKEMQRFAYTVSHDLKSPLVTIKGFLQLLGREAESIGRPQMTEDIERITRAADRMAQLLDELLELSRVGRVSNPPERVPVAELARRAIEVMNGPITERGVRVDLQANMPDVYGDRSRLQQVYQNLIENAVKFIGDAPEPVIEIGAELQEDKVLCYVKDNGIGIAHRHQELVFRLFERARATGTGTGVGLTLVRRIVELHDGEVWIESEGEGKGATFFFTLPSPPA